MTFEYAGEEYRITFKHGKFELPNRHACIWRGVRCRVIRVVDGGWKNNGFSYCHPSDNFCRETGRKLALRKAVNLSGSRKFRTAAWKAYLGRPRGKAQQYLGQLLKDHGLTEEAVAKARQKLDRCTGDIRREAEST